MKKTILAIGLCMLFPPIVFAQTYTGSAGLVVGTRAQHATSGFTVGAGDLYVADQFFCTGGINQEMALLDVATASNTSFKNTAISTATLVAAATTFTLALADYTDIIVPRNIVIIGSCTPNSSTYSGTAVITGVDAKGVSTTETITVSTFTSNNTTGTTVGTGNIAWSSITSVALTSTATDATSLKVQIGSGIKIGMPSDIQAAADVYKVIEAGSLTTAYTLSTTYDTITFVNAPDASKDYMVFYKFKKR